MSLIPTEPEVQEFIKKFKDKKELSKKEFLLFCKEAVEIAKRNQHEKHILAYWIVSKAWKFRPDAVTAKDETYDAIGGLAASLELPDYHVYLGEGLSVAQGWEILEQLVDEGLLKLKE